MREMLYPLYNGKRVVPSVSAAHEMDHLEFDLSDIVEVLEHGFDCARSKRKEGILERCLRIGKNKLIRAVAAEGIASVPEGFSEEVYKLIHVSVETFKRGRFRYEEI